jgi:hypothetical protein
VPPRTATVRCSDAVSGLPTGERPHVVKSALCVVACLLISVPKGFELWTRITGTLAAVPFGVYVALWVGGASPSADGPVAGVGWMMLTVTIVGWIIAALRQPEGQR